MTKKTETPLAAALSAACSTLLLAGLAKTPADKRFYRKAHREVVALLSRRFRPAEFRKWLTELQRKMRERRGSRAIPTVRKR